MSNISATNVVRRKVIEDIVLRLNEPKLRLRQINLIARRLKLKLDIAKTSLF